MSAASVSKKKASSFVVAASMSAVEALKDQAGLCRWDYAILSVFQRAKPSGRRAFPASASPSPRTPASSSSSSAACAGGRSRQRAEDEKLRKAYHLVCWGPN